MAQLTYGSSLRTITGCGGAWGVSELLQPSSGCADSPFRWINDQLNAKRDRLGTWHSGLLLGRFWDYRSLPIGYLFIGLVFVSSSTFYYKFLFWLCFSSRIRAAGEMMKKMACVLEAVQDIPPTAKQSSVEAVGFLHGVTQTGGWWSSGGICTQFTCPVPTLCPSQICLITHSRYFSTLLLITVSTKTSSAWT